MIRLAFIILIIINSSALLKSQDFSEYPFQISDYYFVNYDSNEIKNFGDNKQFNVFYSKL